MQDEIRSFMVVMDKTGDTTWIENGLFVKNPLVDLMQPKEQEEYSPATISRLFGELTGLAHVKEIEGTIIDKGVTYYVVKGFRCATDTMNELCTRTVTVRI